MVKVGQDKAIILHFNLSTSWCSRPIAWRISRFLSSIIKLDSYNDSYSDFNVHVDELKPPSVNLTELW